jgi:FkbM family methyltransferase
MKLAPWEFIGSRLFFYGVWEPSITSFVRQLDLDGKVAIDIGANIGYYSLLLSARVGPRGRVAAVEPSPTIRKELEENIRLNDCRNIQVIACGISNVNTLKDFYLDTTGNAGKSRFAGDDCADGVLEGQVQLRRLIDVVSQADLQRTGLIKVDVEGMEVEVLGHLVEIADHLPNDIVILSEIRVDGEGDPILELVGRLQARGFVMYSLFNDYRAMAYASGTVRKPTRIDQLGPGQHDIAFTRGKYLPS